MAKERSSYIPCIIPCGGSSTRLGTGENKCIAGSIPPLYWVINFWRSRGLTHFIFIIGGEHANETTQLAKELAPHAVFIDRGKTVNLASAILLTDDLVDDRFVLALGDCINIGDFVSQWDVDFGIGVCITDSPEFRKNYAVHLSNSTVMTLIEKPQGVLSLCGMGTYFLHRRIFDYIRRLKLPTEATSVDLTGALQLAIGSGESMYPIYFEGTYINITYPQDVQRLEELYNASTS